MCSHKCVLFKEVPNLTMVANHGKTAREQYLYDHQGAQPHCLGKNRNPICNTLGSLNFGMRTFYHQGRLNIRS